MFFCRRIGFVIDVRRHCTNSASKSFINWEKGRSQPNQNCLFIRPTISLDILRGKQSNVEDYPTDQVPVVPVLFTVVSWVIDDVLVVVHSCTDEKNIINIKIVHSCKYEPKSIALLLNQVIFWYLCRFHWRKCASLWKISSRRCWKKVQIIKRYQKVF